VVRNGIDVDECRDRAGESSIRTALGIGPDRPVIAFVGRSAAVKNISRFLACVRRLQTRLSDLHVVIAGRDLDETAGRQLAPDLAPSRTHFLGVRQDVPAILADSNLLLITSDAEGCPNVLLESLAVGTPVVATDVGDIAEMIPAGCGEVVAPADSTALDAAVVRMLRPDAKANAEAARHFVRHQFDYDAMVERTVALWDRSLARPSREYA
jgi:glycosyltransferase involved in cell wall biosynthesis